MIGMWFLTYFFSFAFVSIGVETHHLSHANCKLADCHPACAVQKCADWKWMGKCVCKSSARESARQRGFASNIHVHISRHADQCTSFTSLFLCFSQAVYQMVTKRAYILLHAVLRALGHVIPRARVLFFPACWLCSLIVKNALRLKKPLPVQQPLPANTPRPTSALHTSFPPDVSLDCVL